MNERDHPRMDKLSLLTAAISISARAIQSTAIATKIQQAIARIIEFSDPVKTLLALKNIPDPIQLPTTTSIAEKKPICFLTGAFAIPFNL